jgi:hypothetical protein
LPDRVDAHRAGTVFSRDEASPELLMVALVRPTTLNDGAPLAGSLLNRSKTRSVGFAAVDGTQLTSQKKFRLILARLSRNTLINCKGVLLQTAVREERRRWNT